MRIFTKHDYHNNSIRPIDVPLYFLSRVLINENNHFKAWGNLYSLCIYTIHVSVEKNSK